MPHASRVMLVGVITPQHCIVNASPLQIIFANIFTQTRQELAARLVEKLYGDGTGKPSKWWMSFQKRRFMNRSLGT
jgi:hypothetical protein